MAERKFLKTDERTPMRYRKIAEWEDHDTEPGGDTGFVLEAVDAPLNYPCYTRVSWSELSDKEFAALDRGETIDLLWLRAKAGAAG